MAITFKVGENSLTEFEVKDYFDAIWSQSDGYYNKYVKDDWAENDLLYQDAFVFPVEKLDWQSDIRDPITETLVTRLTNFFTRILVSTNEDYFTIRHPDKDRQLAYKELLKVILRENEYPNKCFKPALERALLNSLYNNKVNHELYECSYPTYDSKSGNYGVVRETQSKTKIQPVSPKNVRLDPLGDRYRIEIMPAVPLNEFEEMGKLNGWKNIKRVVDAITIEGESVPDERPLDEQESTFLRTVNLKCVQTRALTDKMGKVLVKDIRFYIANNKHVLWVEKNLLPDGMFYMVSENPLGGVYGRYGRAYISKLKSLIINFIESVNLAMDGFRLSALGIYEYDIQVASADTAHQFTAVLEPGKFYPKAGQGRVLNGIFNNSLQNAGALQVVFFLDRELQNRSFQNEFFQGQPTAKGRPTLGEISIKTQESTAFFTDIATNVERMIVSPVLYLALVTELIYMDDKRKADLLENISDENVRGLIKGLTFDERIQDIRNMKIEVTGISGKIKRLGNFNKLIQIMNVLGNVPGVLSAIRSDQLVRKLFEITDDTPDEIFDMTVLPQIMQQQQMMQQQGQQTQPPQGAGNMPVGLGG